MVVKSTVKSGDKMTSLKKVLSYLIVYLLILQFGLPYLVPTDIIYDSRMNYDLVKDRITDIEPVFERVKAIIDREKLKDYVVIIGDSVGYSRPGPAHASLAYYLNQRAKREGKHFRVFNLSIPGAQTGDYYAILLKMKDYGISSDHVVINLYYSGFLKREPGPPAVFWLQRELQDMDPDVYQHVKPHLLANISEQEKHRGISSQIIRNVNDKLYENVSMLKYKDYLQVYFKDIIYKLSGKAKPQETVLTWRQKPFLKQLFSFP